MKKLWWIIPVLLVLGGVGYFYYQGYDKSLHEYLPGTYINGMDVSCMNPKQVEDILNEPARSFVVKEMNAETREPMEETLDLRALGYYQHFDTQKVLDEQRHSTWFYSYWEQTKHEVTYDGFAIDENVGRQQHLSERPAQRGQREERRSEEWRSEKRRSEK